jgi:hypothetical protein
MLIILSDRSIILTGPRQVYSRVAGPTRRLATEIAQSVEALGDKICPVMRWLKYIQTAYAAGHPQPHPQRYRAHGSWLTTNYDVLLPLLPKGIIYAMNTNPNHSFFF